jgi:hypothetical protein
LKSIALLVSIVFGLALENSDVLAQGPPQYMLTMIVNVFDPGGPLYLYDINSAGVAVGFGSRAVLFEPSVGLLDLNTLLGAMWEDLDTNVQWSGIDSPWIAASTRSINDQNQIVGRAVSLSEPSRAFVLHDPLGPSPKFELLPRVGNTDNRGWAINELGVIVATASGGNTPGVVVYNPFTNPPYSSPVLLPITTEPRQINSSGVIVTRTQTGSSWDSGYLIDPKGSPDYSQAEVTFSPGDQFYGINESGMICGRRNAIPNGPPSNRVDGGVFRFQFPGVPTSNDLIVNSISTATGVFCGINKHGDVAYAYGGRGWLLLDGEGLFNLDNLIQFDSPADQAAWMSQNIQPRGINDNGQIIAQVGSLSSQAALLTPIEPDPNAPLEYERIHNPALNIPDNNPNGVSSTILVGDDVTIENLKVTLNITHSRPSDLRVHLYGPHSNSPAIQLTNFTGANNVAAFNGTISLGSWTVKVVDTVKKQTGELNSWKLTIER